MSNMKCLMIIALFLLSFTSSFAIDSPCGDWVPYKDEKCFKLVDDTLRSFDDAEKSCAHLENSPSLAIIRSQEEQDFLTTLLFKTLQKVDNVWLGARVDHNKLSWVDHSNQSFTNWAQGSPRNTANYCLQMQSDEVSLGKWVEEPCKRKNLVLCQRMQTWSTAILEKILLDARKEFRDNLEVVKKENQELKLKFSQEIAQLKQTMIPLGFLYFQLPKDKAPGEIWPWMNWTDVSASYSGLFFRVEGSGSAAYGQVQEENTPRLEKTLTGDEHNVKGPIRPYDQETDIPKTGWSQSIPTGGIEGYKIYIQLKFSDLAEVRPRNMAMRVWKRTG